MNTEAIVTKSEITESGLYAEAWRGFGRSFPSVSDAVAAYKSPAMKAAILAADSMNH